MIERFRNTPKTLKVEMAHCIFTALIMHCIILILIPAQARSEIAGKAIQELFQDSHKESAPLNEIREF